MDNFASSLAIEATYRGSFARGLADFYEIEFADVGTFADTDYGSHRNFPGLGYGSFATGQQRSVWAVDKPTATW